MIREATIKDAPGIAETHVDSWRSTYQGQVPDSYLAELSVLKREEAWKGRFQTVEGRTFVAEENGEVVGFADFGPTRDRDKAPEETVELYAIYLRQTAKRSGLGRKLFEQGLDWARRNGFRELTTLVLDTNQPARRFYKRMGMTATDTGAWQLKIDKYLYELEKGYLEQHIIWSISWRHIRTYLETFLDG